jgi:hypothetical protein
MRELAAQLMRLRLSGKARLIPISLVTETGDVRKAEKRAIQNIRVQLGGTRR